MLGVAIVFVFILLLLPSDSASYPSCPNSRAPLELQIPLKFCPHKGTVCCDSAEDLGLQQQFEAMNISDPQCASRVKSILCSVCDPFSAHLFNNGPESGTARLICNSSVSEVFHQSKAKISTGFMNPTPFNRTLREAYGGALDDGSVLFGGEGVSLTAAKATEHPAGVCLEKIGNGNYVSMLPHPDGSNRVFVHNLQGKIWLVSIPEEGSKRHLQVDETKPFLDITDQVLSDTEFGMVSMAFHPNFVKNGRFFVSYFCDKTKQPNCLGRCACNTDVNCDPSQMTADGGIQPCQYHVVIAEYTVNGNSSRRLHLAKSANSSEVRRIMTIGLPSRGVHAGQILISPADGCLYFMLGDNGRGNQRSFAQDKNSILGKILRIDIDRIPSAKEIHDQGLWGNYSIPTDNPYANDKELAPEVWALGLRLPWRCSIDSKRPFYFICGDAGENQYEEVDIIIKGGNYGWPVYEGPYLFQPEKDLGENATMSSISPIFPVLGYNHSEVNKRNIGSASISGGFIYRSTTDPCMYGRYLYMDLYARAMWSAIESQENSGNFRTSQMDFRCADDSPIQCQSIEGSNMPALGYVSSFAQDNRKDIYLLTTTGEYRVTRPSRCSYQCSKESFATTGPNSSAAICGPLWKHVEPYISIAFNILLLLNLV